MPPLIVLACAAFEQRLRHLLPEGGPSAVVFLEAGLHQVPRKLRQALQARLDQLETPSRVLLGYGLCGNSLDGLHAGANTLIMPRSDDCIAVLFGSRAAFLEEFDAQPGTYYLTPAWLDAGISPLHEFQRLQARLDLETARWVMDQQYGHYTRLLLLATTPTELDHYRPQALAVAEFCRRWGLTYAERLGSDAYLRQLVQAAQTLTDSNADFLIVPPGGVVEQAEFLRDHRG